MMPSLDFFSLSNSSLAGPSSGKYKLVQLSTGGGQPSLIIPAQTTNYLAQSLASLEAGTKLISIGVDAFASGPWQMTTYNSSAAYMRFALFDSAGVPWFLHDIGALQTNYSVGSITIDLVSGVAATLQTDGAFNFDGSTNSTTGSRWKGVFFNKPSNFNVYGPLTFAVLGTNATTGLASGNYFIAKMRLVAL
ncbi:hypothetical protein [Paenibacillus taichungensis]|uniref:hypothetical protein n=1 Tax=Paenibacillus taichungensis TaxID=484184 RepID=UPI0038D0AF31